MYKTGKCLINGKETTIDVEYISNPRNALYQYKKDTFKCKKAMHYFNSKCQKCTIFVKSPEYK